MVLIDYSSRHSSVWYCGYCVCRILLVLIVILFYSTSISSSASSSSSTIDSSQQRFGCFPLRDKRKDTALNDRRQKYDRLIIGTFNLEWAFDGIQDRKPSPWTQDSTSMYESICGNNVSSYEDSKSFYLFFIYVKPLKVFLFFPPYI